MDVANQDNIQLVPVLGRCCWPKIEEVDTSYFGPVDPNTIQPPTGWQLFGRGLQWTAAAVFPFAATSTTIGVVDKQVYDSNLFTNNTKNGELADLILTFGGAAFLVLDGIVFLTGTALVKYGGKGAEDFALLEGKKPKHV
jgi:hypothetical protein